MVHKGTVLVREWASVGVAFDNDGFNDCAGFGVGRHCQDGSGRPYSQGSACPSRALRAHHHKPLHGHPVQRDNNAKSHEPPEAGGRRT